MMVVFFEGPRGGNIDTGLQAYATLAMGSFAKQLNIQRFKTNIQVNFHHRLYVDRENSCEGLCEFVDKRNYVIDVALYGNWVSTLAHEMVHVKQFIRGEIDAGLTRWKNKNCIDIEYWNQPWEKEARKLQHKMVHEFENYMHE